MTFYKASAKVANMKKPILSIEEELAACRKAFQENPKAKYAWCCHHSILLELLTEPCENRIQYILENKEKKEQAIRFRNFRPLRIELPKEIIKAIAKYEKARAKYDKALAKYNEACAKCNEACDKLNKALATWTEGNVMFLSDWPDNTWNGKNIF